MAKGVNFQFKATNSAKAAMGGFRRDLKGIQSQVRRTQAVQKSWNKGLSENRRAIQQVGFQVTDFAVQVSGGQSAMLAFVQQGGQVLQFFGPFGAILASLLAVFGSLGIAFVRSGKALSDLTPLAGVLREEFQMIGKALGVVKELMIDFTNVVVNNLDTILIAASLVAGFFAARWVAAIVTATFTTGAFSNVLRATVVSFQLAGTGAAAATLATSAWTGALGVLRIALIRLGIPALIIAAAYLIERFLHLKKVAGGFGNALGLLRDVAVEVFSRIRDSFALVPLAVKAGSAAMAGFFVGQIAKMSRAFVDFTADVADGFNAIFGTNLTPLGGSVAGYLESMASDLTTVAETAKGSMATLKESLGAPLGSLTKLRDLMKETKVDVRDWFGGGSGEDSKGGSKAPASRAKKEADRIKKIFDDMQKSISQSMMSSFKSLLDGSKSFGDAARDILGSILDKIIDLLMTPIFNSIAGSIAGGIMGGLGGIGASFDGGGFTGAGVRAGGMDGKGGKLAMVHPNETVVDHTKGQSLGGNNITFNIQTPDVDGFKKSARQISRQAKAALG